MLTTRKGNKRFAFYDLSITLDWEAVPAAPADAGAAGAAAAAEALAGASLECAAAGGEGQPTSSSGGDNDAGQEAGPAGEAGSKEAATVVVAGTLDIKEFGSVSRGLQDSSCVAAAAGPAPCRGLEDLHAWQQPRGLHPAAGLPLQLGGSLLRWLAGWHLTPPAACSGQARRHMPHHRKARTCGLAVFFSGRRPRGCGGGRQREHRRQPRRAGSPEAAR